jgi:hypothetical protein
VIAFWEDDELSREATPFLPLLENPNERYDDLRLTNRQRLFFYRRLHKVRTHSVLVVNSREPVRTYKADAFWLLVSG